MFWLLESIFSLVLSFFSAVFGVMTSDTLAGTTFVAPPRTKRQRQQEGNIPATVVAPARHANNNNANTLNNTVRERSLSAAREVDDALQRRRVELCKYFLAATVVALCAAVAAWDRWPVLWLLRGHCVIVFFCALVKGPAALDVDFIRVPLMILPWLVGIDLMFFD